MKIAILGTGYVGLVSGVCFSDFGHNVVCVDNNPEKIAMLERGEVPIYEPGLDAVMARNVEAGRLSFTTDLARGLDGAQSVFIAVGTPTRRGDGHADLNYVIKAAEEIARTASGYIRVKKFTSNSVFGTAITPALFTSPVSLDDAIARTITSEFVDKNSAQTTFDSE